MILLDSSFLFALNSINDKYHQRATEFARGHTYEVFMVPDIVLTEVTYMLRKTVGVRAVVSFLDILAASTAQMETLTKPDIARAARIMQQYPQFDFVDCGIVALAERLNLPQICTFDRRDFAAYQPAHVERLDLLP